MENYFNYFTEIEEQYRKCRSEPVLLSPIDWALIESWKEQDFPLAAVLAGIERSFEKFKTGKRSYRKVNALAYCSQEVYRAVEESRAMAAQGGTPRLAKPDTPAPFSTDEISRFFVRCAVAIEGASQQAQKEEKRVLADELAEAATTLRTLGERAQASGSLEEIERNLTALEVLTQLRAEVDRGLVPYRRKMAAAEVDLLERRFLKNRLLEHYKIPRLSLFYL